MADNKVNSGLLEFSEDQKVFVALDAETSEVKKAVTIDEDGVETDMLGVHPTGKKEITSTAEVNVANYATAQVVDEDLVAGNIKKDVDILGVVGTYEAPACDFATAVVTVTNTTGAPQQINICNALEDEGSYTSDATAAILNEKVLNVIMYKGTANGSFEGSADVATTGGVTYDNGYLIITGDGTITLSRNM